MELVLSPGRLGGDNTTGSPFHNQEVREWSHVDRLTGMLEHARIETGRWQTRHQGTAQAYGKVIDSRERNSANGNVVQKARRQVEVFQSQGIGGRSVQVVRASQWSSSRITDSTSTSPVSVNSMNDVAQLRNGNDELTAAAKSLNGRLCSPDESLTKLSQVSRLCRQINGEAAVTGGIISKRTNFQTSGKTISAQSPVMINNRLQKKFNPISVVEEENYSNRLNSSSLIMNSLKSTSNEDLSKSTDPNAKSQAIFTRDCKARRSLQIPKSVVSEIRSDPESADFIRHSNSSRNSPSSDKDALKNERKMVKSYVLGMEEADSEVLSSSLSLPKQIAEKTILFNGTLVGEMGKDSVLKSEYLRPTPILLKPKSNTTVVHLNNKLFLDSENNVTPEKESIPAERPAILVQENDPTVRTVSATSRVHSLASRFANGSGFKSVISGKVEQNSFALNSASSFGKMQSVLESSSRIEGLMSRSGGLNGGENALEVSYPTLVEKKAVDETSPAKPVKKVGFCKTEVHFAAESGKVNIVETDAKPPPSNRFRRRRRNSVGISAQTAAQGKNLPLIHFGDTSYEKYIFGQPPGGAFGKEAFGGKLGDPEPGDLSIIREKEQRLTALQSADELRDGWRARLKTIMQSEPPIIGDDSDDLGLVKNYDPIDETTVVDHSFKGSHTTTVNLGANVISKIQKHTNEDNIDKNHMINDELDNIVDSGLPVEEICFEANRTVEKSHALIIDRMTNESNVVTSDNENNKVLLNIVTTHEPVIARVEDGHSPESRLQFGGKKLRSNTAMESEEKEKGVPRVMNKSVSSSVKKSSVKQKAKDHCDNKSAKELPSTSLNDDGNCNAADPTYVNVFENGGVKIAPIYENYRVTRKNKINVKKSSTQDTVADAAPKTTANGNGNCDTEAISLSATDCEEENFKQYSKSRESEAKLTTISETNSSERSKRESHKAKTGKTRSKKTARPPSSASSVESLHRSSASETPKDSESRPMHTKSTRSSRLHRVTSGQEPLTKDRSYPSNEKKKNTTERTTGSKTPRSSHPSGDKNTAGKTVEQGSKSLNDSTGSKKPIEIVYQTAVFNMKNEKLAKSSKSKESKTPRYINDLICGSKPKRSNDGIRHVKGTALQSQQLRVNNKSASPTNRHWK